MKRDTFHNTGVENDISNMYIRMTYKRPGEFSHYISQSEIIFESQV